MVKYPLLIMRLRGRMKIKLLAGLVIFVLLAGVTSNSFIHTALAQKPDPKEEKLKNQEELKAQTYGNTKENHEKTTKNLEAYKGQGGATSGEDVKSEKAKDMEEKKAKTFAEKKESYEKSTRELKPYPGQQRAGGSAEDIKAKKQKEKQDLEDQTFAGAKESHEKTITKNVARR